MFRPIIIASMLFSSAVYASTNSTDGKARLGKMLNCETSMISKLSEGHQDLLQRLKRMSDQYDLIALITPDVAVANMGVSIPAFYAEMTSLAEKILRVNGPYSLESLEEIMGKLENQISVALNRPDTRANGDISEGKRRMETRRFEEDWSHLDRRPSPSSGGQPQTGSGPMDSSGYTLVPDDFSFGGFRPNWPPREKP
jgi:hypothetical protein